MSNMYVHKFHSMLVFNSQCSFLALKTKIILTALRVVVENSSVTRTINESNDITKMVTIKFNPHGLKDFSFLLLILKFKFL